MAKSNFTGIFMPYNENETWSFPLFSFQVSWFKKKVVKF